MGPAGRGGSKTWGKIAHLLNLTLSRPAPYDFPHNIRHWRRAICRKAKPARGLFSYHPAAKGMCVNAKTRLLSLLRFVLSCF